MEVERTLDLLLQARQLCATYLADSPKSAERARDVLYLDLALQSSVRTAIEGNIDGFSAAAGQLAEKDGVLDRVASCALVQLWPWPCA